MKTQRLPKSGLLWFPRDPQQMTMEAESTRSAVATILQRSTKATLIVETRLCDDGYIIRITNQDTFELFDYPATILPEEIARGFLAGYGWPN
jgi:hypothetical protein